MTAPLLPPGFPSAPDGPGLRLVPFSSLGADGVLPAFRPDRLTVQGSPVRGWVAVSEKPLSGGAFTALLPPTLLDTASNPET